MRRRCDRPLPAGRGPLPPYPRLPRGAGRSPEPIRHHHAWTDDRSRHRRPRRGGPARERLRHLLDPDARRRRLAETEPRTAHPRQRLRALSMLVNAGNQSRGRMAPILPGLSATAVPTCRSRRRLHATPEPAGSGRTCSTSAPARASTFSTASPATGPKSSTAMSVCTRTDAPTFRAEHTEPIRVAVAKLARDTCA